MNKIKPTNYYVPAQSHWPITGSIGLLCFMVGFANTLHANPIGKYLFALGAIILIVMMYGWFRDVVNESMADMYSAQLDRSFRWGMAWFIVSEVFFFIAFFGALFYLRNIAVQWLGGAGSHASTKQFLWPAFEATWPLLKNPSDKVIGPHEVINPWGLPLVNTVLLLTSSVTITFAHHALRAAHRKPLIIWTFITVLLGITFLICQGTEYYEAYTEMGLTLNSGIYGSTFFMLTGFHGMHVTIGTIMLTIMLIRSIKGHFTPDQHFAFEASSWYWHFVDVVWLGLFIFVYIL